MKTLIKALGAAVCGALCIGAATAMSSFAANIGDVNNDNAVNAADASDILVFYADASTGHLTGWTNEQRKCADVNKDHVIDASDASDVLGYYAYAATTTQPFDIETYFDDDKLIDALGLGDTSMYANIGVTESYNAQRMHVGLKWNAIPNVDGYVVDFYTDQQYDANGQPFKYSREVTSPQFTAQLPATLGSTNAYRYRIKPYKMFNGKMYVAREGYASGTWDHKSAAGYTIPYQQNLELFVNAADLKPHYTYEEYNIKQDNVLGGVPFWNKTWSISQNEIDVYNEFARTHFKPGMTNYQKIWYLADWMHENVVYANVEQYNQYALWDGNFVRACLSYQVGQCLQYNGALAEIMSYMGYDSYMMEMWSVYEPENNRKYQHYRSECTIDGIRFSFEVGDKGSDYPPTGYRWLWIFDMNNISLYNRPAKPVTQDTFWDNYYIYEDKWYNDRWYGENNDTDVIDDEYGYYYPDDYYFDFAYDTASIMSDDSMEGYCEKPDNYGEIMYEASTGTTAEQE